ncbi:MAG: hypothetical protein IJM59_04685, partial [Proteobacteria bacterium]|nr:hypothetical protein [Pseudomonadota bacterium]
ENGYLSKYDCGEKHHCEAGVCYEDINEGDPCDASKFTQQCQDDGNVLICAEGTVTKVPCGDKVCTNGACTDPACDPATFKASCNGSFEAVQCKNGVVTKTACPENEFCADGECKPGGNVGDPCDPNIYAKKCDTDGKLMECVKGENDSYKIVETTCQEGTPVCLNGACVQCDPAKYEMTCLEGKKWTCEADGSLKDTLCPANKNVCYNNDCAECDPTKTAKTCDGTDSYKMCNASGLFETKKCPDSYTCQDAGNCTNTCDDDHPCTAEHYVCDEGQCKFQAECINTEPATCSEDNKSIKKCVDELYEYTPCGATEVCKNGACIGNECDPDTYGKDNGGKECADDNNWAICDNGYIKKTACPTGEVCKKGICMGNECDPDTFGTQCKADGITQIYCANGHIVDYGTCSGEKGICLNGACVECDSSKTTVKCSGTAQYQICTDNKYSTPLYCDTQSETCKDGKGCVSLCGDDFKNHCDESGKRVYCDGTTKTIKTEECSYDSTCVAGKCESRSGKPCAIHEFKNVCHVDSKNNKVMLEECSDLGTIHFGACGEKSFCGEIQGLSDCYTDCDTENQTTCLYSSLKADIGKCLKGTEVKADGTTAERLGIYTVSGICEDDNLSISCHTNSSGHPVFDYFFCGTIGGGTCQTSTGTCSAFTPGMCSIPGGNCEGGVATNCVRDPALDGYVMTQMTCSDYIVNNAPATCVTYTLDGIKTARCLGSHEFNFSGNKYDVSTLGTCIGTKTLATMHWSDKTSISSHSSECNTSCEEGTTDSGEKFHYCK